MLFFLFSYFDMISLSVAFICQSVILTCAEAVLCEKLITNVFIMLMSIIIFKASCNSRSTLTLQRPNITQNITKDRAELPYLLTYNKTPSLGTLQMTAGGYSTP